MIDFQSDCSNILNMGRLATSSRSPRAPKPRDPLSQLLASGALRSVLLFFATHEEATPTVRGLARATGLGLASLEAEIARLERLGVLARRRVGRAMELVLDVRHPLWAALRTLIRAAAPPSDVLRAAFADVPGIEDAFVFGSTAKGTARRDSDVDVLVIGVPDERLFARRTIDASVLLGRDVAPLVFSRAEWRAERAAGRPFVRDVLDGPKVWLLRGRVAVDANASLGRRSA